MMSEPGELERRIARFLASRGGAATSVEIARELLGVRGGREQTLTRQLRLLLAPGPVAIRNAKDGWRLSDRTGRPAGSLRDDPFAVVAADLPPGGLRPARVALFVRGPGDTGEAVWPDRSAAHLRRLAKGRTLLVTGRRDEREALAVWLRGAAGAPVEPLPLDALLRAAGERVPARRRGTGADEEDGAVERCRRALHGVARLIDRLAADGIDRWEDAGRWRAGRPGFDFTGRDFDRATLRELPPGPGVYRFHDADGELVYVGQSKSLRRRVGSYFRPSVPPGSRAGRIAARTHRIEIAPEGSDLAAQVREASEIRRLRPAANTQRAVRERAPAPEPSGDRVFVLAPARGRARVVILARDGRVVDRASLAPGPTAQRRAERLLARTFFARGDDRPAGEVAGRSARGGARRGISAVSAVEASRLLASWLRRHRDRVLSFDPGESPGAADAARRLVAYLSADPSDGAVVIR